MTRTALLMAPLLLAACGHKSPLKVPAPETDTDLSAASDGPCEQEQRLIDVREADVLFVIDNSNSMQEEQDALARELPRMARALVTGDADGDGEAEWPAVESLHLGVVSTNMGASFNDVPGCLGSGDDGRFRTGRPHCDDGPQYLSYSADSDQQQVAEAFSCRARLGTEGCGLEQQLEAMLKSLVPSTATFNGQPLRFSGDTPGHGDGANEGFVRRDSLLAVVLLTDEEDCSIPDYSRDLFSLEATSSFASEPLNLRCGLHTDDDVLQPIARFAQGLLGLRAHAPELLLFAAIAGLPEDLEGGLFTDALLDPRMQFRPRSEPVQADTLPAAACESEHGTAYPGRRFLQLADELDRMGAASMVRSICAESYENTTDAILTRIGAQLSMPVCADETEGDSE